MTIPDRPLREVTYKARDPREGMTPAEATEALRDATVILRCRTTVRGKIVNLVVMER